MKFSRLAAAVSSFLLTIFAPLALAAVDNSPVNPGAFNRPVRVTCVGDSITAGYGIGSVLDYYPTQLGRMLGPKWTVSNFGGSGATALRNGDNPYYRYTQFANAIDSAPDVVVLMLGANDAKAGNWTKSADFKEDYRWMIRQFKDLPSNPRIYICRPCFAQEGNGFGILESNILTEIPWIDQLADEENTGLIDNHAITLANPTDLGDGVHPNSKGAARIAENTFHSLTGEDFSSNIAARELAGKMVISWATSLVSTPVTVSRATAPTGPFTAVSSNNTTGTYTDTNVTQGSIYYYQLATTNIYGAAATSPVVVYTYTAETGLLNCTVNGTAAASTGTAAFATDGLDTTDWTTGGTDQTATIQYDHGIYSQWAITSYRLVSASGTAAADPSAWEFEGSDNGVSWTALDSRSAQSFSARKQAKRYSFTNIKPYRYYRLRVTATTGGNSGVSLAEFQLWSEDSDSLASASLEVSGGTADKLFDGFTATKWYTGSGSNTAWIQYRYGGGAARSLSGYRITTANDVPQRDPASWQVIGSNDGTTWSTPLDTQTGVTFANRFQTNTYTISPITQAYRYYRLNITTNSGGASSYGIQLSELSFTEAAPLPITPVAPALTVVNGQINLVWTATTGAASYTVKRASSPGGPYVTVISGLSGTSFTDASAIIGVAYYYTITATNAGGDSAASTASTTAGLTVPPSPPIGLSSSGQNLAVNLVWSASTGATSYTVKRSPWNGGPYVTLASGITTTSYQDTGLLNGTTWYYSVSATGTGGESGNSAQTAAAAQATTTLPTRPFLSPLFSDRMVLQREAPVPVWGWTTPGVQVSVTINGQTKTTVTPVTGRWQVEVGPFAAGGPYAMTVVGTQTVKVNDILFGDVFIFSGQSNMERQLGRRDPQPAILNYEAEAAAANFPNIRQFSMPLSVGNKPQELPAGSWFDCTPANVINFSAVGYFTARSLFQATNVPIGIIHSAYGGTRIDPWLENQEAARFPEFSASVKALPSATNPANSTASAIYNSMIAPLAPFRVKGAFWYQGESSADRPEQYSSLLPALMKGWRRAFGQPTLPFVVIQLPNYLTAVTTPVQTGSWAEIREAQKSSVENDPFARLVTTIDIGNADIHPPDKQDVGQRSALAALDVAYGQTLVSQGPLFTGAVVEGSTLRCSFSNVGSGLMVGAKTPLQPTTEVVGGTLTGFAIAGADKVWVAADAVISGNTVVVSAAGVTAPRYVRYGWAYMPACNLYNKITSSGNVVDGLPASPFRNDPVARLNVVSGTGSGNYAPGSQISIGGNAVSGGAFISWYGDTAFLANPSSVGTTASLAAPYVSVGGNYQLVFAPAGLAATGATLSVNLTWTALTNATSYNISRSTSAAGPFSLIASGVLAASYTDNTSGFGTAYYYRISASNLGGEGPATTAAVTATGTAPSSPTNFTATAGNGVIALGWNAVVGVDGYTIRRSTTSGSGYSVVLAGTPGTLFVDTGLTNGVTYYYTVATLVNGSSGPTSAEVSAVPSAETTLIRRSVSGISSASGTSTNQTDVQAFDLNNSTKWLTTSPTGWLQYEFPSMSAWSISQYTITSANDKSGRHPKDWTLQGSNDGTAWTVLDSRAGEAYGSAFVVKSYTISPDKIGLYRFYRLNVTANNGETFLQLAELGLFSPPTDQGDKTPPVFGATPNLSANTTSASGTSVSFNVSATDAVGGAVQATSTPASGSLFPVGTTTVTSTAIDFSGNQATASFTVTVINTSTPVSTAAPSISVSGSTSQLSMASTPGHNYQLQRSYNLVNWQNVGALQAGGGTLNFSDTADTAEKKAFYRVVIDP